MKLAFLLAFSCILSSWATNIHYDKKLEPAAQFAIKDLATTLSKVTGKKFTLKENKANYSAGDIIVFNNPKLEKQQWHFQYKDGKLFISGRGTPGIVYGIYTFLEKYANCSWPSPDVQIIPENKNWQLPNINEKNSPAIKRREIYVGSDAPDWIWRMRNKENHRVAYGLNMFIGKPQNSHSFDTYVKAIKDPKLFGPKISGGTCNTLCMTNPKVREIVANEMLKYIALDRKAALKKPSYSVPKIYDLSQADGPSWGECWCDTCKKITLQEGSYSGANIDFVNYIAKKVKAKYPDIIIQTFAYSYTQKPPKNLKALDNVMVRYCDAHLYRPLVPNTPNAKELKLWSKYAAKKAIWSYWRIFDGYLYPFVKPLKDIANELKLCAEEGVYSYFSENEDMLKRSFAIQQHYLCLKLLDNPNLDINKVNANFMKAYYGEAAPYMQQYLEYLEKRQEKTRSFLDKDFFTTVNKLLDQAEAAVKQDPKSLVHVKCERVIVDRTMFLRIDDLRKANYQFDAKKIAARFLANGIAQINSWGSITRQRRAELIQSIKDEANLYSHFPVPIPERFKNCDVIDLHWTQVQRGTQNAVRDLDAICQVAIRNPKLKHKLPYKIGFYSSALKVGSGLTFLKEDIPTDEKFHLYKLGSVRILAPLYLYYDQSWRFRGWLSSIGVLGEEREIWVSLKFQGKTYVDNSTKENCVLIDRILLVKNLNPLSPYQKVNPKNNILKNGNFDAYSKSWLYNWNKFSNNISIDTKEKKSGRAALKISGQKGVNVRLMSNLGNLKDMKQDLLIRGWYKYDNIDLVGKYGTPFIGLWPLNRKGNNTTYSYNLVEVFNGSSPWRYFEKVIEIDAIKKAAFRAKPQPGESLHFRITMYNQPGTLYLDKLEVIPLVKK